MNIFDIIILSIVEGITEFLPVSSTGHLILAANVLHLTQTEFVKTFEIIIQMGAILAVLYLYWSQLVKNPRLWINLVIGFLPSAVVGLILYDYIKDTLLSDPFIPVITLFLGGIILVFFDKFHKPQNGESSAEIGPKKALLIGMFQVFSIIPGVSRSAATIIGGMLSGLNKKRAAEFSFMLAIPTMFGATALDLAESELRYDSGEILILASGVILSFLSAIIAVKFLVKFLQKHSFSAFGFYRILLSVLYYLVYLR